MLNWIAQALASATPYLDKTEIQRARALIESTGIRLGRSGQASLALADGRPAEARSAGTTSRDAQLEIREARGLLRIREGYAQALVASEEFDEARAVIDKAVPVAREAKLRQILWRLLALKAIVLRFYKDTAGADAALAEARALQAEISETISNIEHRENFLQGRVAQQLQVV